jgi:hypothetical protein
MAFWCKQRGSLRPYPDIRNRHNRIPIRRLKMMIDEPTGLNPDTGTPPDDPQIDSMTIQTPAAPDAQVCPAETDSEVCPQPNPVGHVVNQYNFATGTTQQIIGGV